MISQGFMRFVRMVKLYDLLKNEKYIGKTSIKGKVYSIYPRIIPQEVFDIAKQKIEQNKYGKHVNDDMYLLRFKVTY